MVPSSWRMSPSCIEKKDVKALVRDVVRSKGKACVPKVRHVMLPEPTAQSLRTTEASQECHGPDPFVRPSPPPLTCAVGENGEADGVQTCAGPEADPCARRRNGFAPSRGIVIRCAELCLIGRSERCEIPQSFFLPWLHLYSLDKFFFAIHLLSDIRALNHFSIAFPSQTLQPRKRHRKTSPIPKARPCHPPGHISQPPTHLT